MAASEVAGSISRGRGRPSDGSVKVKHRRATHSGALSGAPGGIIPKLLTRARLIVIFCVKVQI